jgi:hypothetical protein
MLNLHVTHEKAFDLIAQRIEEVKKIRKFPLHYDQQGADLGDVTRWFTATEYVLEEIYGVDDRHVQRFRDIQIPDPSGNAAIDAYHASSLMWALLLGYLDEIKLNKENPEFQEPLLPKISSGTDENDFLDQIFDNFHSIALQLKTRKHNKPSFDISDEYDVQDLLQALMMPVYSDIRIDEPTPSFAGKFSKIDFALNGKHIAIEVKIASNTHIEDKISRELLEDIAHYGKNNDINLLICFIYDPNFDLKKRTQLTTDLEQLSTPKLQVRIVIRPKG